MKRNKFVNISNQIFNIDTITTIYYYATDKKNETSKRF